jgi:ribosomal protein S8
MATSVCLYFVEKFQLSSLYTSFIVSGEFEIVDDHRGGKIVVNLTGRINKCSVISPRFDVSFV